MIDSLRAVDMLKPNGGRHAASAGTSVFALAVPRPNPHIASNASLQPPNLCQSSPNMAQDVPSLPLHSSFRSGMPHDQWVPAVVLTALESPSL